ncbi:MAG: hypothetical protein RL198_723 [Actinomycetota bacterium]
MPESVSIERFQELFKTRLSSEQIAAITAPFDGSPSLVVAGAGSGKTKVMALRAVWLVASEYVQPSEIVGLTFTRRAASELDKRLQQYLSTLKSTHSNRQAERLWPDSIPDDSELPKVSTYNSFAVELFQQRALALGYEPDALTLGEADGYRLARRVALNPRPELNELLAAGNLGRDTIVDAILSLSHELADNNQTAQAAREYLINLAQLLEQSPLVKKGNGRNKYFQDLQDRISEKTLIADLAGQYQDLKVSLGFLEYSDQVMLALRGAEIEPITHGYKAVLLDEYQDTSPIQAKLLATVFRDSTVMAVGDPRQAIYGWRGASTANLSEFLKDFGGGGSSRQVYSLTTNWRSAKAIVDSANVTSTQIDSTIRDARGKSLQSQHNQLGYSPDATPGKVWVSVSQDQQTEAERVADWFLDRLANKAESTAAILFRNRRYMATYAQALERRRIPYSISGLGGMLEMPEVADLVSALRVIFEVDSGIYLMRLLAGPRWRIGAGDIAALSHYAAKQTRNLEEFDNGLALTLTESLDDLLLMKQPPTGMTPSGFERMQSAANLFRKIRKYYGLGLSELARLIAEELQLDIELIASSLDTAADPLRNLNAFYRLLDDYENRAVRPSMSEFLEWLNYAADHERLEPPSGSESKGVVQLLTIHAAKGLEWQYVAIPSLVQDQFPSKSKDNGGWLGYGKLPFALRQDKIGLPEWRFIPGDGQQQVNAALKEFKDDMARHRLAEERRVAYVAMTRAEEEVLLAASFWRRGQKSSDALSEYLLEQIEAGHLIPFGEQVTSAAEQNPLDAEERLVSWPTVSDPARLADLAQASQLFESAQQQDASGEINQLLAERERRLTPVAPLMPRRLSASALVALIDQPEAFARRLARPLPSEFSESAALGTEVHAALESAFMGEESVESLLGLSKAAQSSAVTDLLEAFLASDFANGRPDLIEHEIEFVLGPFIVTCKLDAVFKNEFGYEIIDWKTGAAPSSDEDLARRSLQLAIYRLALSELTATPIERVSAGFFFLKTGQKLLPKGLEGRDQLEEKINRALRQLTGSEASK